MDRRLAVHTTLGLMVLPLLVLAPVVGCTVTLVWACLGWHRSHVSHAATVVTVVVVVGAIVAVSFASARSLVSVVVPPLVAVTIGLIAVRVERVSTEKANVPLGLGAALLSTWVCAMALVETLEPGAMRAIAVGHHPNATAALGIVLAGGSALAWTGSVLAKIISVIGLIASPLLVLLTASRAAIIGLGMGAFVATMIFIIQLSPGLSVRVKVRIASLIAAVALIGLQVVLLTPHWWPGSLPTLLGETSPLHAITRFDTLTDPLHASGGRIGAWNLALDLIQYRPILGYGFNSISQYYSAAAELELAIPLVHPHNGFLALLLTGGSTLFVSLLALLTLLGYRLIMAAVYLQPGYLVIVVSVVAALTVEMFDSLLRFGSIGGPLMLIVLAATGATTKHIAPKGYCEDNEPIS